MTFASSFLQFTIGGVLTAGAVDQDEWQIGFKVPVVGITGALTDARQMAFLDDAELDARAWWTTMAQNYGVQTGMTFVKVNLIGQDGRYANTTKTFRKDFPKVVGTSPQTLPADVALVVSLTTGAARGLASKGRVFLPPPSSGRVINGRVDQYTRDDAGNATALLIKNLGNAPGLDSGAVVDIGDVSVMSKIGVGTTRTVTGVRVGDLFDTQRRRSNRMREVYTSYPLP